MAARYLPTIAPQDYDAFRRLVGGLPHTYEKWLQHRRTRGAEMQAKGYLLEDVDVDPDEFARYASRSRRNTEALFTFATEKGMRKTP